jgi:hypothetical protein
MKRNLERERLIHYYWDLGGTIRKIHEKTGIPMSTIGYYTKKYGPRKKAIGSFGSDSEMPNTQPLIQMERVLAPDIMDAEATKQKRTKIIINDTYEKWQKKVDELMSKGDYRSAKDLCGAIFSIYQVDKVFNMAIKGSEVWSNGLFILLTEYS